MRITVTMLLFLGACAYGAIDEYDELAVDADEMDDDSGDGELGEIELAVGTKVIYNFKGQPRYVRVTSNEVKLFMNTTAEAMNDPRYGFRNTNHYDNSCGPTAAMNVYNWYGIVELEGKRCYWMYEAERPDAPPIWICQDRITAASLGQSMKTNNWYLFGIGPMPGTNTANFRSVFKYYMDKYRPSSWAFQYLYEEGGADHQYAYLWATLAQGNTVVVNYKTGSTKGHFAVIVGMQKAGDPYSKHDDLVYLANGRKEDAGAAITWGTFHDLWRRDYTDFGTLSLIGEHRYTRMNLWDTAIAPPIVTGGGGGSSDSPPTHQQ
jgi:hypothetical protein